MRLPHLAVALVAALMPTAALAQATFPTQAPGIKAGGMVMMKCDLVSGAYQNCRPMTAADFGGGSSSSGTTDTYIAPAAMSSSVGTAYTVQLGKGQGTVAFAVTGLAASGATLQAQYSDDNGANYYPLRNIGTATVPGSTTFTADGPISFTAAGHTQLRLIVTAGGSGTITIGSNASVPARGVNLEGAGTATTNPIYATITGTVAISNFPSSFQISNFPTAFALNAGNNAIGSITNTGFNVNNFPTTLATAANQNSTAAGTSATNAQAFQGVTGGVPVPISSAQEATIAGNQTSGGQKSQVVDGSGNVAGVGNATALMPTGTLALNTRATLQVYDLVGNAPAGTYGNLNGILTQGQVAAGVAAAGNPLGIGGVASGTGLTAVTAGQRQNAWYDLTGANFATSAPSASTGAGIAPTAAQNAASVVLKAAPGNLYSINAVNSTAAGFIVVYNGTAAPTSGAAISTANGLYCMPVAASAGFDKAFQVPIYGATGIVLLLSTSCTTYTPVATAPITLAGQVK